MQCCVINSSNFTACSRRCLQQSRINHMLIWWCWHYCTAVMNKGSVFNATSSLSTLTFTRKSHLLNDNPVTARMLPGITLLQAPTECLPVCFLSKEWLHFVCGHMCVCVCVCVCVCTVELGLTNVSFLQGRRVIYTITCHSYNGSHSLASFHNDKLLLGWCTGEHNFSVVSVTVSVACLRIPVIYPGVKSSWTKFHFDIYTPTGTDNMFKYPRYFPFNC